MLAKFANPFAVCSRDTCSITSATLTLPQPVPLCSFERVPLCSRQTISYLSVAARHLLIQCGKPAVLTNQDFIRGARQLTVKALGVDFNRGETHYEKDDAMFNDSLKR